MCQQAKLDRAKLPGLLHPLLVPKGSWQVISLDFIEGLPRSGKANCILVVVDEFSKFAYFIPLVHPFATATVAKAFIDNVYKLHGLPTAIISDRDRVFTSNLWQELFKLADVKLHMSSAYHPQTTDDQTERVNQCLETYLRCFMHVCPQRWAKWLSSAEFWYNSSHHSAIDRSPFEVLMVILHGIFGFDLADSCEVPDLVEYMSKRQVTQQLVHQHLLRTQRRMKHQADKHRSERSFAVGDWVFLKLQPYVQASLAPRSCQKLAFKFFGPY